MTTRFLVIGGSGFTGGFVIDEMMNRGLDVVAMARSEAAATKLRMRGAEVVMGDLDVTASLESAMRRARADRLVNLASLGFGHAPSLVATAELVGFEHCVFISTTAIFTKLNAASRAIRVAAEEVISSSSLSWTILRPTMIYGAPGDRNIERLIRLIHRAPAIVLPGGGGNLQQPVHVEDLAAAIAAIALRADARIALNLPGPAAMTLRDLVLTVCEQLDRHPVMIPAPLKAIRRSVGLMSGAGISLPISVEQIDRLTEDKAFAIEPAQALGVLASRAFTDGVKQEISQLKRTHRRRGSSLL